MGKVYTRFQTQTAQRPYPMGQPGTYLYSLYLTIIPRARMESGSIAHEAEGQPLLDFTIYLFSNRFSQKIRY